MTVYTHYYSVVGAKDKYVRIVEDSEGACSFTGKLKEATNDFASFSILEMLAKAKEMIGDVELEHARTEGGDTDEYFGQ